MIRYYFCNYYFIFSAHKYHNREEFLADIKLIESNCEQYNGPDSSFTKQAKALVEFTKSALDEVMHKFYLLYAI